ncbi:hypothetical protein [Amycolatopsis echigonensis]|uniref:Uncharacterized protein n=1 Tax=Amycolatopsis echigonensis TaxID=2576905 RepID=A0A8E1W6T0_9PSEU|nr:hypothetical protein [Amycolatopsis echigonensis]MBB2504922.1 hypothetical protein [Amycolatopsis echigonensis]
MSALVFLAMAAVLGAVGWWGRRHAPALAGFHYDEQHRRKNARVIRRGGAVCWVMAALFTAFAVLTFVTSLLS